ncbi:hypothetical protein A9237_07075 [Vibrio owensii]|nr:hypothetical protein A9237_07075 [Vibrio owensii]
MHVCQIIPTLSAGGAEKLSINLSNELAKSNIKTTLIVLYKYPGSDKLLNMVSSSVNIIQLNYPLNEKLKMMFSLTKNIIKLKPNVVHCHLRSIFFVAPFILLKNRFKLFFTLHSRDVNYEFNKWQRRYIKILINQAGLKTVLINNYQTHSFIRYFNEKFKIIKNAIPLSCQSYDNHSNLFDGIKVAHVGRLDPVKNQVALIKAAKSKNISLTLICPENQEFYEYSREVKNEIDTDIKFISFSNDVIKDISSCDFFCLSSYKEGLPLSLLESMSIGLIPILTPFDGHDTILDGLESKYITEGFSAKDIENVFNEIKKVKKGDVERMKADVISFFRHNYSMEKCIEEHISYYRS